jgi:predicted nucleic acid-binding protein
MKGILVDSNVILDVFEDDPEWADWSEAQLEHFGNSNLLYINSIIYTEVSIAFKKIEELEKAITGCGFRMLHIPKEGLFLAGKVFLQYKKRKGRKTAPLPDFYIGAHAAVSQLDLLTRDIKRYHTYFPTVRLICPETRKL